MNRPPYETFTRPTCKGDFSLGTACGTCEKCKWERQQALQQMTAAAPVTGGRPDGFYWARFRSDAPCIMEWSSLAECWSFSGVSGTAQDHEVTVLTDRLEYGVSDAPMPPLVTGHRILSPQELELVNGAKALAVQTGAFIEKLKTTNYAASGLIDLRWLAIGTTDLQTGWMAVVRSIAKPTTF